MLNRDSYNRDYAFVQRKKETMPLMYTIHKYLSWEINSLLEGILVTWDGRAAKAMTASSSRDVATMMWKLEKGAVATTWKLEKCAQQQPMEA